MTQLDRATINATLQAAGVTFVEPIERHEEWYDWQPNRTERSKEPQDWPDFMVWLDQWGRWTKRTVPIVKLGEQPPKEPAWCATVYGGSRR